MLHGHRRGMMAIFFLKNSEEQLDYDRNTVCSLTEIIRISGD